MYLSNYTGDEITEALTKSIDGLVNKALFINLSEPRLSKTNYQDACNIVKDNKNMVILQDENNHVYIPVVTITSTNYILRFNLGTDNYVLYLPILGSWTTAKLIKIQGSEPIGAVSMWIANTLPSGWLELNGQQIQSDSYPELYKILTGKDSGNTNLPDFRNRFPIGNNPGTINLNAIGGNDTQKLTVDNLPSHTHSYYQDEALGSGEYQVKEQRISKNYDLGFNNSKQRGGGYYYNTGYTGKNTPFSIMPPYIAVKFIIKAL